MDIKIMEWYAKRKMKEEDYIGLRTFPEKRKAGAGKSRKKVKFEYGENDFNPTDYFSYREDIMNPLPKKRRKKK